MSERRRTVLVCGGDRRGSLALAASLAVEVAAESERGVLLAELAHEPRRRSTTLLASPAARELERALRDRGWRASARGHVCHLGAAPEPDDAPFVSELADDAGVELLVVHVAPELWGRVIDSPGLAPEAGLLLADLPGERSLAALWVSELHARGMAARVEGHPPALLAARRALAGIRPGGVASVRARRLARALTPTHRQGRLGGGQSGQALPLVLAAAAALIGCALVLASIGGAVTGKARVQRAADLAALSAARVMRDTSPRLLAPARLPDGSPNPRRISRAAFLASAKAAALEAAERNGVDPRRVEFAVPDAAETPPLRARVAVRAEVDPSRLPGGERLDAEAAAAGRAPPASIPVVSVAVAEAGPPAPSSWSGAEGTATGGGYSGPLAYRNGEGMRPDVAAAFDRMAAAARGAGHLLLVNSGFRSDAEQAALFAAHPDPRWVAPPGRSLHRCATELDLGPSSAYGWLAANASRFGFLKRYSWEPWHYGFSAGPPPCSAAGESGGIDAAGGAGDPDGEAASAGLPAFVPARYREPILRSAARWNVGGALLAAQLMAESAFNPRAVSPAGAVGIAQFMPGTAAAYGLRDPFDAEAAIDAQAHLMSDLLRQFRSVPLALAAYNAGPGAVSACSCAGPYAETRAYVARILALLDGAGAALSPLLEVRLVE